MTTREKSLLRIKHDRFICMAFSKVVPFMRWCLFYGSTFSTVAFGMFFFCGITRPGERVGHPELFPGAHSQRAYLGLERVSAGALGASNKALGFPWGPMVQAFWLPQTTSYTFLGPFSGSCAGKLHLHIFHAFFV